MSINQLTMISMRCSVARMQSLKKWIFVLFIVLLIIIDLKCTVDGLSTANERGMYVSDIILFYFSFLFCSHRYFGSIDSTE